MAPIQSAGFAPIIDGLEVFEIEVDGDDRRWGSVDRNRYHFCNGYIRIEDFPVKPGKRLVRYVLLSFGFKPTNQQVMDEIVQRKLIHPDRAITESILNKSILKACEPVHSSEGIAGICGTVNPDFPGSLATVHKVGSRMYAIYVQAQYSWCAGIYKFIAVVSEEALP